MLNCSGNDYAIQESFSLKWNDPIFNIFSSESSSIISKQGFIHFYHIVFASSELVISLKL